VGRVASTRSLGRLLVLPGFRPSEPWRAMMIALPAMSAHNASLPASRSQSRNCVTKVGTDGTFSRLSCSPRVPTPDYRLVFIRIRS